MTTARQIPTRLNNRILATVALAILFSLVFPLHIVNAHAEETTEGKIIQTEDLVEGNQELPTESVIEPSDNSTPQNVEETETYEFEGIVAEVAPETTAVTVSRAWDISPSLDAGTVELGESVTVSAGASGEGSDELTYNYVWSREGSWAEGEWGSVANETGSTTPDGSWEFTPRRAGSYTLYVSAYDRSGISLEKVLSLEVTETYEFEGIGFSDEKAPKIDEVIEGSLYASGTTSHLEFKVVWEKDSWSHWGVLKDMSPDREFVWKPSVSGDVNIHVDIKDSSGDVHTVTSTLSVDDENLHFTGVTLSPSKNLAVGDSVTITPQFAADTTKYLKFKYVWVRDDWKSWGVLSEKTSSASLAYILAISGDVEFYVDIVDSSGKVTTRSVQVDVEPEQWSYNTLTVSSKLVKPNSRVSISASTSGQTDLLYYKFVWERNGWSSWGIITSGTSPTASWTPSSPGDYTIYCDIVDSSGSVRTKQTKVSVWSFSSISVTSNGGSSWNIKANVGASNIGSGLKFKFVWATTNWSRWGVLSEGTTNSATFKPSNWGLGPGTYSIFVDVVDAKTGSVTTRSTTIAYAPDQAAMTSKVQLFASNTNWLIAVNTTTCRVGVYRGSIGNWTPVYYWTCSPGAPSTPTVIGQFTVQNKGYVFGYGYSCYYWTQFYGDYLFHSVLYNPGTFTIQDGRLGQHLSHGCVRLAIENAKWIYDNIPRGTKVITY